MRDLESSLAYTVCLNSLLRHAEYRCTTVTRTQLHMRPYTQHTCTHTSKYIIMHAQDVSEVTITSPNHCHVNMYV